jgi:hypothetical protein
MAVADLDGDGQVDVVISLGNVQVRMGKGDGTFAAPVAYGQSGNPQGIVAVDLDGDGKPDLAYADPVLGAVGVLRSQGAGTFGAAVK